MKHSIRLFDDTSDEYWGGLWAASIAISVMAVVALGVIFGLPTAFLGLVPGALFNYGIFGHVLFNADDATLAKWKRYKKLPDDYRRSLGVKTKDYAAMNNQQKAEFNDKIHTLEELDKQREQTKSMPAELRTRFDVLIEKEKNRVEAEKAVKKELSERGWDS